MTVTDDTFDMKMHVNPRYIAFAYHDEKGYFVVLGVGDGKAIKVGEDDYHRVKHVIARMGRR